MKGLRLRRRVTAFSIPTTSPAPDPAIFDHCFFPPSALPSSSKLFESCEYGLIGLFSHGQRIVREKHTVQELHL